MWMSLRLLHSLALNMHPPPHTSTISSTHIAQLSLQHTSSSSYFYHYVYCYYECCYITATTNITATTTFAFYSYYLYHCSCFAYTVQCLPAYHESRSLYNQAGRPSHIPQSRLRLWSARARNTSGRDSKARRRPPQRPHCPARLFPMS